MIADIINADVKYAAAVEAAIEGFSDALIINSTHRFLADDQLREQLDSNDLSQEQLSQLESLIKQKRKQASKAKKR